MEDFRILVPDPYNNSTGSASLLFIGAGAGAGEKNTRSQGRPKMDRLHNTEIQTKKATYRICTGIQYCTFLDPKQFGIFAKMNRTFFFLSVPVPVPS